MTSTDNFSTTGLDKSEKAYRVREAVALFSTETAFLNALDSLQENGFDRADLSVLGGAISRPFESASMLADDKRAKRGANANPESVVEAEAAAIGIPVYVGALGAFFAVAATGGALALAIPMTLAGGLAGGGLGAIGAHAIEKRHRRAIEQQIDNGGLLLWVRTNTPERVVSALRLLKAAGGQEAHVHEAILRWGVEESPLSHFRPDPFLEKEPYQN